LDRMTMVKLSMSPPKSSLSTSVTYANQAMVLITMVSSTKVPQPVVAMSSSSMTRKPAPQYWA